MFTDSWSGNDGPHLLGCGRQATTSCLQCRPTLRWHPGLAAAAARRRWPTTATALPGWSMASQKRRWCIRRASPSLLFKSRDSDLSDRWRIRGAHSDGQKTATNESDYGVQKVGSQCEGGRRVRSVIPSPLGIAMNDRFPQAGRQASRLMSIERDFSRRERDRRGTWSAAVDGGLFRGVAAWRTACSRRPRKRRTSA